MLNKDLLRIGMIWRLRRVAAGLRQQDVAGRAGLTTTRLSAIERGEQEPSELDRKSIERLLPELPTENLTDRLRPHGAERYPD
jgi:transcriptional regulator with XRE-family HTH domain